MRTVTSPLNPAWAAIALCLGLNGCAVAEPDPVTKACMVLGHEIFAADLTGTTLATRCGCVDQVARAQLDQQNYAVLSKVAQQVESSAALIKRARASSVAISEYAARQDLGRSAVAIVDFASFAHKAALKCSLPQGIVSPKLAGR